MQRTSHQRQRSTAEHTQRTLLKGHGGCKGRDTPGPNSATRTV